MKITVNYLIVIVLLQSFYCLAGEKCKISKRYIDDYEPAVFHNSNNLVHDYQSLPDQSLQVIIIKGKVLDQNCIPIANAKVYAWQVGADGKYPYVALRNLVDKKLFNHSNNSSFLGSGISVTDNLGRFIFITIHPIGKLNYINLRTNYYQDQSLQTKFFINSNDDEYYFDIVVPKFVKK